jgi:hypothetical protein
MTDALTELQQDTARRKARTAHRESLKQMSNAYRDLIRLHEEMIMNLNGARELIEKEIDKIDDEVDKEWATSPDKDELKRWLASLQKRVQ